MEVLQSCTTPSILREQRSWGQHGAHLGPVGPRWAPCWPYEPCYQGIFYLLGFCTWYMVLMQVAYFSVGTFFTYFLRFAQKRHVYKVITNLSLIEITSYFNKFMSIKFWSAVSYFVEFSSNRFSMTQFVVRNETWLKGGAITQGYSCSLGDARFTALNREKCFKVRFKTILTRIIWKWLPICQWHLTMRTMDRWISVSMWIVCHNHRT